MSTQSNFSEQEIRDRLKSITSDKSEEKMIIRDSLILQANYLSEIERLTREKGIAKKDIAISIKTSPSYLTQVFRGDKPLNFITLAKIKRVLGLKIEVNVSFAQEKKIKNTIESGYFLTSINTQLKAGSSTTCGGHMVNDYSVFLPLNINDSKLFLVEA